MLKKIEDILSIVEKSFLSIPLSSHYDIHKLTGYSTDESFKLMRARICDDLINNCRPLISKMIEEEVEKKEK